MGNSEGIPNKKLQNIHKDSSSLARKLSVAFGMPLEYKKLLAWW